MDDEDIKLSSGEYAETQMFEVTAVGPMTIRLTGDFDGYLMVQPPDFSTTKEGQLDNDDWMGDLTESRVEIPEAEVGAWRVLVTTSSKGVGGNYTLAVTLPAAVATQGTDTSDIPTSSQQIPGKLAAGDKKMNTGEYFDRHVVTLALGELLEVTMESDAFDTYLVLQDAEGNPIKTNDNFGGSTGISRLAYTARVAGTYGVIATSGPPDVTGTYSLTITQGPGDPNALLDTGGEHFPGRLTTKDRVLDAGNYMDIIELEGAPGEWLRVQLNSTEFDAVLYIMGSDTEIIDSNDDFASGSTNARITFQIPADGKYALATTSVGIAEGEYELVVSPGPAPGEVTTGILTTDDEALEAGEFFDRYEFKVKAGETVEFFLESGEFDAFLIVLPPEGDPIQVNDTGGSTNARYRYTADASGPLPVIVTSRRASETGAYALTVSRDLESSTNTRGSSGSANPSVQYEGTLTIGTFAGGRLEEGDMSLDTGQFRDTWVFEAIAGQIVFFEMASTEFDTYLELIDSTGDVLQNDNLDGQRELSGIQWTAPADGPVEVVATSYRRGESGRYRLSVRTGSAPATLDARSGNTFGVFVGVSDYAGDAPGLPGCADDALSLVRALMEETGMPQENAISLTNKEARTANVRDAILSCADRMQEGDTFVFFFSGRGAHLKHPNPVAEDPDGHDALDEALWLHDGLLLDDELNQLLAGFSDNTCLVILDACFSGGFSKDVIKEPGRMGLFTSSEDLSSSVASKFEAGGFLAGFIASAVGSDSGTADRNGDRIISAAELNKFIDDGYRRQADQEQTSNSIDGRDRLKKQQLVIESGSVAGDTPLFILN
ncbi:MAG: hypothetical protein ACI8PQ_001278 [Planctomycetota bacterium]